MSYHRVLPPPSPAIQDPSSWGFEPDSLLRHKIMPTEPVNDLNNRKKSLTPSQKPSSPERDKAVSSPGIESLEDYVDSPPARARSCSQISSESHRRGSTLPSVPWQGDSSSLICLCQPDPKIPRPRNAFILYRQHHQKAVTAQYPGLANPEISKVIGDRWRSQPQEVKTHWKLLADREKHRHQELYPNYRYKPRRTARKRSFSDSLSTESPTDIEARRCAKCGGRSITTPFVMPTPGLPSNMPITPLSPNHPPSTPSTGSSAHRFLNGLNSPQSQGQLRLQPRPNSSSNNLKALQLASTRHPDRDGLPSPDPKRRRIANGNYHSVRTPAPNEQLTPFPFPQNRRESLPRPDFMPRKNNIVTMGPPPRPSHGRAHPDASLKLPPLKTSPTTLDSPALARASSVEAMIMSIHPLNKIRVLAKISPPLPSPGPGSPAFPVRGFAIAIDGSDMESVNQLTESLTASLSLQHPVRVFESPVNHVFKGNGGKGGEAGIGNDFSTYLNVISQYHILSKKIISYITTPPSHPSPPPPSSPSPVSPKTHSISDASGSKPGTQAPAPQKNENKDSGPSTEIPTGVPIALLPCFQLSHTNAFASRILITDTYAPVDHWQWMASLWRGIIGPDVTIAILPAFYPTAPNSASPNTSSSGGVGSTGSGTINSSSTPRLTETAPRMSGMPSGGSSVPSSGVEARLEDARAILVRGESGKTGLAEGKLRRVGFEVGEWVRGGDDGRRGS